MDVIYEPTGRAREYAPLALNLYSGCSHSCSYCVHPNTLVLMGNGTSKRIKDIQVGDTIYGVKIINGSYRYVKTQVLAHWSSMQYAYRVELKNGIYVICSEDHRWLDRRGAWKSTVKKLSGIYNSSRLNTKTSHIRGIGKFTDSSKWNETVDYRHGYLCGIMQGDGCVGHWKNKKTSGMSHHARLVMKDHEAIDRADRFFKQFKIKMIRKPFPFGKNKEELPGIITSQKNQVDQIQKIIQFPYRTEKPTHEFYRGFLAGIFDAEGSYSDVIRISNSDLKIMIKIQVALRQFRFEWKYDKGHQGPNKYVKTIRLIGGLSNVLRFFQIVQPAILRKTSIEGRQVKSLSDIHKGFKVKTIRPSKSKRKQRLFDITTGTENFIANGLISHNCFGPDILHVTRESFHSDIKPRENILARLTKDVEKLKGDDREILISFTSDPYQPIEEDLSITRYAIKILIANNLRFTILTKGGSRAARDFDLLEDYPKCSFGTTLIFLDQNLADKWEVNTPRILDRIETIHKAHNLGIKTWVSLEPVIDVDQAYQLIAYLHRWVDMWKIGKINYHPEEEAKVDWIKFREKIKELMTAIGGNYYLKKSLTEL